ncbi:hypothetical protein BX600DRAFT_287600 [Xylariales sp. PMI_506]|nr:hypothetical protein BX600DRAFT_287600 [Xylariales sp. PMI_506]
MAQMLLLPLLFFFPFLPSSFFFCGWGRFLSASLFFSFLRSFREGWEKRRASWNVHLTCKVTEDGMKNSFTQRRRVKIKAQRIYRSWWRALNGPFMALS